MDKYYILKRFIEKPNNLEIDILNKEKIYRNLGIYLAKSSILLHELQLLCPNITETKISIDKAITEKSKILNFFEVDFNWEDIGSIASMYKIYNKKIFTNPNINMDDILQFNNHNQEYKIKSYNHNRIQIIKLTQ